MEAEPIVYLNGRYLPEREACIPVTDRGFIFGDGVYEVIPVYGGRLFRLGHHLQRLERSLEGIRLENPHDEAAWRALLERLVAENGGGDLSLYLQVTRGHAPRDHAFPRDARPTVFASAAPLRGPSGEALKKGIAAITVEDIRWRYCHIKAIALLPNILLRQQALDAGADEAILIRDGEVTEGAASNLFIVRHGVIETPPKSHHLLPGITRDLVLELARANAIEAREATITPEALKEAGEIWVTSSTKEIVPVTRLDGEPVGDGRPGPMWRRIHALYQDYKARLARGEAQ